MKGTGEDFYVNANLDRAVFTFESRPPAKNMEDEKGMGEKQPVGRKKIQAMSTDASQTKKFFTVPKLTFIEPKLVKHGDAAKITAGFFGTFTP
ncbi:MAG: hypothetical protein MRK01_06350 [Candidatus Scalindua sp.]|nr:hypothetical protein [Candidatus Scalindua sp.]